MASVFPYEAIIDAGGDGDYADVPAAIAADAYFCYAKAGTYSAFTQDQANSVIVFEPNSTVGDVTLSGDGACLIFGNGCTVGDVTVSGEGCSIWFENGAACGKLDVNAKEFYFNGRGYGTVVSEGTNEAINTSSSSADCVFENAKANQTGTNHGFSLSGDRNVLFLLQSSESDINAGRLLGDYGIVLGGHFSGSDDSGNEVISISGFWNIFCGNYLDCSGGGTGDDGIEITQGYNVVAENIVESVDGDPVVIRGGYDNAVVANRVDGAVNDEGTGNVVANNDTTTL